MSGSVRGLAAAVLVAAGLSGISGCAASTEATPEAANAPKASGEARTGTVLSVTQVSPVDAELSWRGKAPGAAGRIVEFATEPSGPWTVLTYAPLGQTTYRHPDLIPKTHFYYRVRPYYGPASRPVDVTLPKGAFTKAEQRQEHRWAPPRTIRRAGVRTSPVRRPSATPTDLRATVMHANGIRFTWTDHAEGERGYLLEDRPRGGGSFHPVAVLDPDINSFGLITLPNEKRASYRVRPFTYGERSNIARMTTGERPAGRG
ncbi:fibronectin type III domain-containing protein [Streptomyces sp. NPDC059455]|uniref:fibronectin type III domain-containing protein n=1 Tax=Streptomyces sp. NPDC059455 TaxID=3346837 RepID=UPI00369B54A1